MYGSNTADCLRERSQRFMLTTQGSTKLFASPLDALVAFSRVFMRNFFTGNLREPYHCRVRAAFWSLLLYTYLRMCALQLITVAVRSNAWVCDRSLVGIVGSNPTGGISVCLLWVLCAGRLSLRRADHSSRGVVPIVVCLSVIVKPRWWGGPGPLGAFAPWGIQCVRRNVTLLFVSSCIPFFAQ